MNNILAKWCILLLLPISMRVGAAVGEAEADRKIAPADTLIIEVFNEKALSVERRVEAGGTISYPLLGLVKVGGESTAHVEQYLKEKLEAKYLVDAQVTVNVKEYTSQTVTVLGEVAGRLGPIKLPPERRMDILEAIAEAGNFTSNANKNKIQLYRKGQPRVFKLDDLLKETDPKKRVWLEPGDVIVVPERLF